MAINRMGLLVGIAAAVASFVILALILMIPGIDEGIFASRTNLTANQTENLVLRDGVSTNISKGNEND